MRRGVPRTLMVAGLWVALLAGCGGSSTPTSPPNVFTVTIFEDQAEVLVNVERTAYSLSRVATEQQLRAVARGHSEAMRDLGFFGHRDPQGRNIADRLRDAGIPFRVAGEALARVGGSDDPAAFAHTQIMNSPSHRDVILKEGFEVIGVGVAQKGGTYWFTHILVQQ